MESLDAIQEGVARDEDNRRKEAERRRLRESIAMLDLERARTREPDRRKSTKAIASELGVCPRAVELRRRGVMNKLGLKSSLELLRFAMLAWPEFCGYLDSAESEPGDDF